MIEKIMSAATALEKTRQAQTEIQQERMEEQHKNYLEDMIKFLNEFIEENAIIEGRDNLTYLIYETEPSYTDTPFFHRGMDELCKMFSQRGYIADYSDFIETHRAETGQVGALYLDWSGDCF